MTVGIYCLYFESDDAQYYIGESTNIEVRYRRHSMELSRGTHVNPQLQAGFNKHGLPTIYVLETLSSSEVLNLGSREIYWIKVFDSFKNGMNRTIGGEGCNHGEVHPSSLYSNDTYAEIMLLLANTSLSIPEISAKLSIPVYIITNISVGKSAAFLAKDYPLEYLRMQNKVGKRPKGVKPMSAKFISPLGIIHEVKELLPFSIEQGIDLSALYKLIKGKLKQVRGWKVYQE